MILPISPVAWQRVRRGAYGQAYVPTKTRNFEKQVGLLASQIPHPILEGALIMTARFILTPPKRLIREFPHVRPDLDNYLKALKDGLVGVLYSDDAQICKYGAGTGKYYDLTGSGERIELLLEEIGSHR
jgi:crossover junction endodeoxyribonuclease RusA